jgi:EH domain-containing protein 1
MTNNNIDLFSIEINEIVKRTRMAKVHALIISHLKSEMPGFFGKSSKEKELIDNLGQEFIKIERANQLARGDFPDPDKFKEKLALFKIDKFPKLDKKVFGLVDDVRKLTTSQVEITNIYKA